jgi:hypothetical protein
MIGFPICRPPQAVKAPEVTKTFETASVPVAYLDAPEFSKFVADERTADRGGEEDRQGGRGNPLHILLSGDNLPAPNSFSKLRRAADR